MNRLRCCFILGFFLLAAVLAGAEKMPSLIAIRGARIIPVASADIPSGVILIKDGLIEAVGPEVTIPEGATVIEASGLCAYPGLIDCYSTLGLAEIGQMPQTVDFRELGRINPQLRAWEALRPDSMHIPIARASGITAALVAPSGGLISGQSGLLRLTGWTPREMLIKAPVAMHVDLPSFGRSMGFRPAAAAEPSQHFKELEEAFRQARAYEKQKEFAEKSNQRALPDFNEAAAFLQPVLRGEIPLWMSVHADKDIKEAIQFVQREKVKAILYGVSQGWKCVEEIKKSGLPVVFGSLTNMPAGWEDGYDALYRTPALLAQAGVKIAFSSQSSSAAKDLPFHAAKAAAFGLDKREALRAVTLSAAEILGVADRMGSLEKGKAANIVLTNGDILEFKTQVKKVFIDGRETDLETIYEQLLEKYRKRAPR
ncbi:MAG TPA: amidohydrolase family protein [Acidobacteriota bacterium]